MPSIETPFDHLKSFRIEVDHRPEAHLALLLFERGGQCGCTLGVPVGLFGLVLAAAGRSAGGVGALLPVLRYVSWIVLFSRSVPRHVEPQTEPWAEDAAEAAEAAEAGE